MMWPGGQFPYQGVNATYFKMWDKEYDLYKRVDTVSNFINFCMPRFGSTYIV